MYYRCLAQRHDMVKMPQIAWFEFNQITAKQTPKTQKRGVHLPSWEEEERKINLCSFWGDFKGEQIHACRGGGGKLGGTPVWNTPCDQFPSIYDQFWWNMRESAAMFLNVWMFRDGGRPRRARRSHGENQGLISECRTILWGPWISEVGQVRTVRFGWSWRRRRGIQV